MNLFLGGCSVYGHSCYGGMGKRDSGDVLPSQEEVAQNVIQQQEEDPGMVFMGPRNGFNVTPKQFYYIPPLFRQWVRTLFTFDAKSFIWHHF